MVYPEVKYARIHYKERINSGKMNKYWHVCQPVRNQRSNSPRRLCIKFKFIWKPHDITWSALIPRDTCTICLVFNRIYDACTFSLYENKSNIEMIISKSHTDIGQLITKWHYIWKTFVYFWRNGSRSFNCKHLEGIDYTVHNSSQGNKRHYLYGEHMIVFQHLATSVFF